jgi:hypothetical protein
MFLTRRRAVAAEATRRTLLKLRSGELGFAANCPRASNTTPDRKPKSNSQGGSPKIS